MKEDKRGDHGQVGLDELRSESQKGMQRSSAGRKRQREISIEEQEKSHGGNEKNNRGGVKEEMKKR